VDIPTLRGSSWQRGRDFCMWNIAASLHDTLPSVVCSGRLRQLRAVAFRAVPAPLQLPQRRRLPGAVQTAVL